MTDHNLWKNGIEHSQSPTSLTDAATGDGFIATAVIASVTTNSDWKMSLYDAYLDLYERLHGGERPIPKSTTTEASALSGVLDGTPILNITTNALQICNGAAFQNSSGIGVMAPSAYGEMVEDNATGSPINTTTNLWDSASVGIVDGNGIITYLDTTNGDELSVNTGGTGTYQIHFSCTFTNAGGNVTEAGVHVNGAEVDKLEDSHAGDSAEHRDLRGAGLLDLTAGDLITLHVVSSAPTDIVTVYHCHLIINRLS